MEGYKEKVFELLEGLLFLDGFDKNDQEADIEDGEEDSEGDEDGSSCSKRFFLF